MHLQTITEYCTFWIPSVAHNDFQIIEEIVTSQPISGINGSLYKIKSDIERIKPNTFSIRLTVTETTAAILSFFA